MGSDWGESGDKKRLPLVPVWRSKLSCWLREKEGIKTMQRRSPILPATVPNRLLIGLAMLLLLSPVETAGVGFQSIAW